MKIPEAETASVQSRWIEKAEDLVPTPVLKLVARTGNLVARSPSSTCAPGNNSGVCEKPVSSSTQTLPIVLGVVYVQLPS